jgi:hypothetical protein
MFILDPPWPIGHRVIRELLRRKRPGSVQVAASLAGSARSLPLRRHVVVAT